MKLLYSLKDNQYPDNGYTHTRSIVRGIVYNEKNQIALIHLYGDDKFGHRDYYETPGGGVEKGERLAEALQRELLEELGASIDNIVEIGRVVDFYNLISRRNNNHYFLCHLVEFKEKHWTDMEKRFIQEIVWVDIKKAIDLYKNTPRTNISTLVINRELPILEIASQFLLEK